MKKEAYDKFMVKMSSEFDNIDSVKEILLDAEELAKYGEKRVALENLLENLLENEMYISSELIDLAEEAFSDNPTNYDNILIFEINLNEKYKNWDTII